MSETSDMLVATATRLYETRLAEDAARASRRGELSAEGWTAVEEAGLTLALLSEEEGGFGVDPADALNLIQLGGYFAAPVPLGETMLANLLLARAGLPLADGLATIAPLAAGSAIAREGQGWHVRGAAHAVPWARHASTVAIIVSGHVVRVAVADIAATSEFSASGLPRDRLNIDLAVPADAVGPLPPSLDEPRLQAAGALIRSLEMAGALERIVELTVEYAGERVQFGRPIGKQQAVQQQLATLAAQAAAASAAAGFAALAFDRPDFILAVAAAKSRIGEAAGIGAAIAHQVHGAIGFTEEHRLHLFTKALWAWRDEYGAESYWQALLGSAAFASATDGYWPFVTSVQPHGAEA